MLNAGHQIRIAVGLVGGVLLGGLTGCTVTGVIDDGQPSSSGAAGSRPTGPAGSSGAGGVSGTTGAGGVTGNSPVLPEGKPPEVVLATCTSPSPGRAPLRRLSNTEYRNTVTDLFAGIPAVTALVGAATRDFPSEPESLGFRNSADYLVVPSLAAQKYLDAAEQLAEAAAASPALVTCPGTPDARCAADFIRSFGKRAFRRPLAAADAAPYEALYQKAITAGYDFKTGIEWIVFAMLQSQQFLYRVELGVAPTGKYTRPTPYEMAARLSYLYWQSMPDSMLFAAADAGQLDTPAQIEAQARRLLADPRADRLLEYFDQWLDLDTMPELTRDTKVYPALDAQWPQLMQQETRAFVSSLVKSPKGSLEQLLTSPYTFMNAALAKHYGVTGPTGTAFQRVDTPGRSGILTQGMLLAHDKPTRTSIVRRGLKVRIDLLCQIVPAPPPDVNINLDAVAGNLTQRQRLEQHRQVATCAACHNLMDPVGVVFEGFDAVGRARTMDETRAPIQTASQLQFTRDADGPVANPAELGMRLANSEQVRECYVTQAFRFFYGRDAESADACSMARLLADFKRGGYSLSELLVGLARTDAFLYRPLLEVTP
jgi:hypothetical protein